MKARVGVYTLLLMMAGCSQAPDADLGVQKPPSKVETGPRAALQVGQRDPSKSIADAPDKGVLIQYRPGAPASKREGAYTWYPIAISEAHALKAIVAGEMTIPSPDGSQVKLRYERHEEHPNGNWTWIGRVVGGDSKQEAIFTFGEKAVFGSIPQRNGTSLSVQTRGGTLYAVQTDLSKVKSPNKGADTMVAPALALRASLFESAQKAQVAQSAIAAGAAPTAANTIDVAIGYTQGFAESLGGQSAAVTRLTFLVDVGNQAFTNSLINGRLRLVNAVQVTYTDSTTNKTALGELTGNNGTSSVPVPAALAPIRTARDQYGADLAVLVRKFQMPENDGCGIAWLNGAGQTAIDPATDDDFGFAAISDGNDAGTDGHNYFCAPETLVHELGHLMGSAHDRDNSKTSTGALLYGRYPYSFGMKTDAANGNFYTIMAYGDNNQNFYRTFSNPLVVKCGPSLNLACGVADQTDNARSLNQTIPVVAAFRANVVPIGGANRGDFNGDGKSDILWRNQSQALVSAWFMNGQTRTGSNVTGVVATSRVVGMGDFDGDGTSDVLWQSDSNNFVWLWRNKGNGTFDYLPVDFYPAGWTVAGVTDINGDGKTDIVFRNEAQSLVSYWLMNGATRTGSSTTSVDSIYRIVGVGDFDGDGRGDILWTNNANSFLWLHLSQAAGGFQYRFLDFYPAGWSVVGVTDFNGDGKADLAWQNTQLGLFSYWLMDGGTRTASGAVAIPAGNQIVATGDFDGDGLGETLWRNDPGSFLWMFKTKAGTTFEYRFVDFTPAGWTVANGGS